MDLRNLTVPALLEAVGAEGCRLTLRSAPDRERLHLEGPRPLPLPLLEALRARKPEIVAHLRQERADLALELYEERAAITEHEGGQARSSAERVALEEAARAVGISPVRLCRAPGPITRTPGPYVPFLRAEGPMSYGTAARALGWGATRAWQAEARLKAAGLIRHDHLGRMVATTKGKVA